MLACGVVMLGVYLLAASVLFRKPDGRVVFGDATHHFVQLRSLVFDRDLQFQNEYVRLYRLQGGEPDTEWIYRDLTRTGHVRNYMPIGPALLWAPLYVAGTLVLLASSALGLTARPDGFEHVLQLVPGVTGVLAATAAAIVTFRMARRFVGDAAAAVGVAGVWLGSHALYYSMVSPSYSHAASMLCTSVFFASWMATRSRITTRHVAGWGALAGLAALMRWQDAVLLMVPLGEVLRSAQPSRGKALSLMAAVGAFAVVFSPQMLVWWTLYGQPLAIPQGAGFMQWTSPHLFDVLFSDNHGLVTWAPIMIPALTGLFLFALRFREIGLPLAAVALVSWYVNGAVADWWAGEAFGARRFLSLFPLMCLGLAWWVSPGGQQRSRWFAWKLLTLGVLVLANGLLLLQYQVFMKGLTELAPYPAGWPDMWVTRFAVPLRLIRHWVAPG